MTSTLLGKGVFPSRTRSLRYAGHARTAYANKAICECDLLINVGSRFDDRIIGQAEKFCAQAKIIHFEIDSAEFPR